MANVAPNYHISHSGSKVSTARTNIKGTSSFFEVVFKLLQCVHMLKVETYISQNR